MPILNPPYIEGKLPAQFGTEIKIPFEHNPTVGAGEYDGFSVLIKTISTNAQVFPSNADENNSAILNDEGLITFNIEEGRLNVGQYYKLQVAYNSEVIGYYSTVGIFKYTNNPTLTLENFSNRTFTCIYANEDITEKVYEYKFQVFKDEVLIKDTDWLLHNSTNDQQQGSSQDSFNYYFIDDGNYRVDYLCKTINGLELSASIDVAISFGSVSIEDFRASSVPQDGYIEISCPGNYALVRRDSAGAALVLVESTSGSNYRDFSIAQGETYEYFLISPESQKSNSITIYSDYEDAFLCDGERQLNLRFNPKISSFKTVIQEQKIDTIGSRYPFFFRNARVRYNEIPISALISLLMDENQLFLNRGGSPESGRPSTPSNAASMPSFRTNLTSENIRNEREFKLAVMNWLNNGQPKLFRSPTEGTYIIRLMNVSLQPNDTLGRMLHTFSATGYEVAQLNEDNIQQYIQEVQE